MRQSIACSVIIGALLVASSARADVGLRIGGELGVGVHDADVPLDHSMLEVRVPVGFVLTEAIGLQLHLGYTSGADVGRDGDADGIDDENSPNFGAVLLDAGPRLVLWTDQSSREGWVIEANVGYLAVTSSNAASDGYIDFAIGRQIGWTEDGGAFDLQLELRGRQGFEKAGNYRALTLGFTFAYETEEYSYDDGSSDEPFGLHYTFGPEIGFGATAGATQPATVADQVGGLGFRAAVRFGIALTRGIEVRLGPDLQLLDLGERDGVTQYSGMAGLRFRFSEIIPLYLEALGGYTFSFGTLPRPIGDGGVAEIGTGALMGGCEGAIHAGIHVRFGLDDSTNNLAAVMFVLGGEYGSLRGATGMDEHEDRSCSGQSTDDEPETPPVAPPVEPTATAGTAAMPDASYGPPQTATATFRVTNVVGVRRVELPEDQIPLQLLRYARRVEVQIVAPADLAGAVERELRLSVLTRAGRIDATTFAGSAAPDQAQAIFTIWPGPSLQ